jgi:hypothetical protein
VEPTHGRDRTALAPWQPCFRVSHSVQ